MSNQNQNHGQANVVLRAQGVSKSYTEAKHSLKIFDGIDFELHEAESVGIVGSSGAGKTTLLNILGGLDEPSSGHVELCGVDLAKHSDKVLTKLRNEHLGFVYQFHHLLAEFSAVENVAMPLFIAGMAKREAESRALDLLHKVGLAERAQHRPPELSGGERQRVAIARALANEPKCVLMDEPTGNLDEATARTIQELMISLQEDLNTAFVVVTHDLQLAGRMDRTLVMEDGRLNERP